MSLDYFTIMNAFNLVKPDIAYDLHGRQVIGSIRAREHCVVNTKTGERVTFFLYPPTGLKSQITHFFFFYYI
jgi:hypothetical protein